MGPFKQFPYLSTRLEIGRCGEEDHKGNCPFVLNEGEWYVMPDKDKMAAHL